MGFRSIKDIVSCEAATNHHKSWQIMQILFKRNASELLVPYVKSVLGLELIPE